MHTIRLRPPWDVTPGGSGKTRYTRRFGAPRLPDPAERVWLVCAAVPGPADVTLNGQLLGTASPGTSFAVDVTARLRPRNEVVFETQADGPLGEVSLEIRGG